MKLFAAPDAITYEMMEDIIKYVSASIGWEIVFDEFWLRMDRVIGEYRQPAKTDVLEKDEEDYDINTVVDELVKANDLLNSFYVRDLERINAQIQKGNYGKALDESSI